MTTSASRTRSRFDYTKDSITKGIIRLSVPTFGEQIAWNIDGIVEIFWVGRLGPDSLAAMSLGFMFIMFLRAIGLGIRIAGSALVAQRIGGGDAEGASEAAGQAIFLTVIFYIPVTLFGYLLAPHLMILMTRDAEIVRLGAIYLQAGFLVFASVDGIFTLAHLLRGAGEPGISLAGMIPSTALSVTLMPLIVFGAGPLPALGLAGTITAVGIGRLAGIAVMAAFIITGHSRLSLQPRYLRPKPELLRRLISLAWPAGTTNLLERGANIVLLRMIAPFGSLALAAWGVGNRVSVMGRMPGFGLQAALRTMVGQNVGANRPERAWRSVHITMTALAVIMGATASGMYLYAEEVVRFFGMKGEAAEVGSLCLRILAFGIPFEAGRRALAGAFQGAADTKPPMVVEGAVRWAIQLPAAYLLAFPLE
ncbi:MAG: MATE family efflux transporter, partial [bacterium]|nr:MATE family efflux transporter [bacterium]